MSLRGASGGAPSAGPPARGPSDVHVYLEAPFGYGKSTELRRRLAADPDGVAVTNLAELLARSQHTEHTSAIYVDDVDTWHDADQEQLAARLAVAGWRIRLVLTGRRCLPVLFDALTMAGTDVVDMNRLRTPTSQLLAASGLEDPPSALVDHVEDFVGGWTILGHRLVRHALAAPGGPRHGWESLSVNSPVVLETVEAALRDLGGDDRRHVEQLAHLPAFTRITVDAIDPGLLYRLRRHGVPIESDVDDRLALIAPLRRVLRQRGRLDPATARVLSGALVASSQPATAAAVLIRTGQATAAAELLGGLTLGQLDAVAPRDMLRALELLGALTDRDPALLLIRARALGGMARLDEQIAAVEAATTVAVEVGDEARHAEARAERLFLHALIGDLPDGMSRTIDAQIADAPGAHVITRLVEARSLVYAHAGDRASIDQAVALARWATESWAALGEDARAATTCRLLAMGMFIPAGRYLEAGEAIDRSLRLSPGATLDRLRSLTVRCRLTALTAQPERSALSETLLLARSFDLPWAEAYVHWAAALLAGVDRDPAAVRCEFEATWRLLGELRSHPTGSVVLAEVSEALARSGDLDGAVELLDRARARRDESAFDVAVAELAVAARAGDEAAFRRRERRLVTDFGRDAARRWQVELYRGVLAVRTGSADAPTAFASARERAAPLVGPEVVDRLEPSPAPDSTEVRPPITLVPPVAGSHIGAGAGSVAIRALGTFEITVGGDPVTLAGSRVTALVKTLVARRGRVNVEIVSDRLWPDAPGDVARRRLKNVLARTRSQLGDAVTREGDNLRLEDAVALDVAVFHDLARRAAHALATDAPEAASLALRALAAYGGPLLPDDLYDDGIAPLRLVEAGRAAAILDGLMERCHDGLVAPVLLEAMLRIDPDDVGRFVTIAQWSDATGRIDTARSAASHARAVAAELGVPVTGLPVTGTTGGPVAGRPDRSIGHRGRPQH